MSRRTLHVYNNHARMKADFYQLAREGEPGWALSTPKMHAQRTDGAELRVFGLVTDLAGARKFAGMSFDEVRCLGEPSEEARNYLMSLQRSPGIELASRQRPAK